MTKTNTPPVCPRLLRTPLLSTLLILSQAAAAEEAIMLDTVVVTGTRSERLQWESPVRTEVVSREDIERIHARDLKEALQHLPGVQLKQIHGKSGYEVWLQGLNADRVLILVDGLPVTPSTGSAVDLTQLSVLEIERIELVKGPTSAQYGSAAMGGVINVITREIPQGVQFGATLDAGSYGDQNPGGEPLAANNRHMQLRGSLGGAQWRGRLSASGTASDGIDPEPDSWSRPGDQTERNHIDTRAEWHPDNAGYAWLNVSSLEENNENRFDASINNRRIPHSKEEYSERYRIAGGGQRQTTDGSVWRIDMLQESLDNQTDKFSPTQRYDHRLSEHDIGQLSAQWQSPALGDHVLLAGVDYHPEELWQQQDGSNELQSENGKVNREGHELLLQDDWFINNDQELLSGLRYQRDSDFGDHLAPKLNYRHALAAGEDNESALRIAVGAGYRVPNLKERHYLFDHSQLGYVVIGNPDLQPEQSLGWQLGWSFRHADALVLDVNVFHNRLRDFIQTDYDAEATLERGDGVIAYSYLNLARAITRGVETIAQWQLSPALTLNAGYTLLDTEDLDTGRELTRRARHQGSGGVDWHIAPERLTASLLMRTQSDELVASDSAERSPGWTLFDTRVNFDATPEWRVFGGIDNLFNKQRDFNNSFDFGPVEGRYLYLGASYRWSSGHL